MIGIYKITSPSGKVYIGQSWNIKQRFCQYKGRIPESQAKLCNSFKKYGVENHKFEILYELSIDTSQNIIDYFEIYYIKYYKELNIELLNIKEGGSRGKNSLETIEKMRKPKSEEWKNKISISNLGKPKSIEHAKKNRIARIGLLPWSAKKVIDTITKEIYPSARVASETIKMNHSTLKSMLNNTRINKTNLQYENRYSINCN